MFATVGAEAQVHEDVAARLRSTHLFGDLGDADLAALAAGCEEVRLAPGETLIREGEPGEAMFVVLGGRLRVTQAQGGEEALLGEVRRGEHLGEIALLERRPRSATVRAVTGCRLLALSRPALEAFLDGHREIRDALRAGLAHRIEWSAARRARPEPAAVVATLASFLGDIDRSTLATLEPEVEWVTLPRGATLMRQREPGDGVYFIVTGRLRVYGEREDGAEVSINECGPGESVGEMALLTGEPRSASVAALRDTELLRLSKAGFDALLDEHPRTMSVFTRVIVDRLYRRTRARAAMTQLRAAPLATPAECDEIGKVANVVLRNLKITQMYHRLSRELTLLIGPEDANWCTFACNASKTAGYSIRREEGIPLYELLLLARRHDGLRRAAETMQQWVSEAGLARRAEAVLDAVSESISAGNLKVFAELGPVFARFVGAFHRDEAHDAPKLARFVETLRPGPTDAGGQEILREAFAHYHEAMFETRPKKRAELILLGNVKIGLHEQTRLQPNIVEALAAPMRVGLRGLLTDDVLGAAVSLLPARAASGARKRLAEAEQQLADRLTGGWRQLVTRSMMTLRLPYGEVRLGADVPRLPNARLFPDVLQELEHPELRRFAATFDASGPATAADDGSAPALVGSRASDWGSLHDRMGFILNLFRSRQKSLELFDQPFHMDQRAQMAENQIPIGRL